MSIFIQVLKSDIPSPNNAVQIEINTINNVSDHILFVF